MDIAVNDINGLDGLNTRDIKLAIGEEVNEDELDETAQGDKVESLEKMDLESKEEINTETIPDNDGVESLKKLLHALSNEDVAASLKGMKISINITLGDK